MDLLKQFDQHLKALPPQLTCGKWTLGIYLRTFLTSENIDLDVDSVHF